MKNIRLYKTIDPDDLNLRIVYKFYYKNDLEKEYIPIKSFDESNDFRDVKLDLENVQFDPTKDLLYLDLEFEISNKNEIFEQLDVCSKDAVLGIGLEWKADQSRVKDCKKIGSFKYGDNESILFSVNDLEIDCGFNNIRFNWIIYLINKGTNISKPYYAKEEGLVLCSDKICYLINYGLGSILPISTIDNINSPLWTYNCNLSNGDFLNDDFCESFEIIINLSHPLYRGIQNKEIKDKLLNEIVADAVFSMIIDVKEKYYEKNNEYLKIGDVSDYDEGTIGYVLWYFKSTLYFDIEKENKQLYESIKTYFDHSFGKES